MKPPLQEKLCFSKWWVVHDEKLIKSMDMTDVMNKTHGVFALDLRWYENDWIINFIGLPEDRNILDILNSTVIN